MSDVDIILVYLACMKWSYLHAFISDRVVIRNGTGVNRSITLLRENGGLRNVVTNNLTRITMLDLRRLKLSPLLC